MAFELSEKWQRAYPGAHVGILALENVRNPNDQQELDRQKEELEHQLRERYGRVDRATLRTLPTLLAYHDYYKHFKKSYHVQLQLESIIFKNKSIPRVAALVEAMFMAELKNQLLTAGHDLARIDRPFGIDVADGSESYVRINSQEQRLKPGDMFIADANGVLSSIIYGPDQRTQIRHETTEVVFTVYAPIGIDAFDVAAHLEDMKGYVLLVAPEAKVLCQQVYAAS